MLLDPGADFPTRALLGGETLSHASLAGARTDVLLELTVSTHSLQPGEPPDKKPKEDDPDDPDKEQPDKEKEKPETPAPE